MIALRRTPALSASVILAVSVTSVILVAFITPVSMQAPRQERIAQVRLPDRAALPCDKQPWFNADRVCLTWTAPKPAANVSSSPSIGNDTTAADGSGRVGARSRVVR
jgi:hypothetical protein